MQLSDFEICGHEDIGYVGDFSVPDVRHGNASETDELVNEVSREIDSGISGERETLGTRLGISMIVQAFVLGVLLSTVIIPVLNETPKTKE